MNERAGDVVEAHRRARPVVDRRGGGGLHGQRAGAGIVATLTLARLEEAQRFGTVLLDSSGGYLAGFHEKNQGPLGAGWLNAGAYVVERELVERIPPGLPCSLEREVFPGALAAGLRLAAFPSTQPFFDIGTPHDFQKFLGLFREWSEGQRGTDSNRRAG